MKCLLFALNLILLLFGSACQVKQAASDGGLISGHAPTTNSFNLKDPTAHTYVTAETLSLQVSFPFPVIVTGAPQISLTIGATTRFATYASGGGTTTMTFSYPVVGTDNDTDGVVLNSLSLNGGTLTFLSNGIAVDCNVASLGSKTLSQIKIDNTGPTITGLNLTNFPGFYHLGQGLDFAMTFSEAVFINGTPRIAVGFTTGGPVYATYATGSGSNILNFHYTITSPVADIDGYNSITSPLDLNAGTIKDASGNDSSLGFAPLVAAVLTYSATVPFDGRLPYVVNVTPPASATYIASQNLDITLTYDRAVTVSGAPYVALTLGPPATVRQAAYLSGSGTTALRFRYTTIPGDDAPNGISIANTITQNAGDIVGTAAPANSFFTNPLNNRYSPPVTTGVIVNAPLPRPISIARNVDTTIPIFGSAVADNIWIIGQDLLFTVGFNTPVYVDQTSGTPQIPITIGATTRYATYLSGGNGQTFLLFRYVIQVGDLDSDTNIAISDIVLNGVNITDSAHTNILLNFPVAQVTATSIDGVRPTISSVTPPASRYYGVTVGNDYSNMTFIVNWNEAVHYSATSAGSFYLPMNVGGATNNLEYSLNNDTAAVTHRGSPLLGQTDTDGVALSSPAAGTATIRDQAGNLANDFSFSPPVSTGVLVDGVIPTVTSIAPPANATYKTGTNLDFAVTFSESVTANVAGSYPRISILVGAVTKNLVPTTNGTGTTHTFRYQVADLDTDTDGVAMANVIQHSAPGIIADIASNPVSGIFTAAVTPLVLVDGINPVVTGATASPNATYGLNANIDFTLTYSEAVNITGLPRLALTVGLSPTRYATYQSGTGTNTIVFRYTVPAGDLDTNGISVSAVIGLNGGTIRDIPGNDQTNFSFPAPNLTALNVDAAGPTISSTTPPASANYKLAQTLSYTLVFDEPVVVSGTPLLSLTIGSTVVSAAYTSGSGTSNLVFQYSVVLNNYDADGVQRVTPLVAGGTIRDVSGNDAILTFTTTTDASVLVDALPPSVSTVTSPVAGAYQNGGTRPTISFTLNFSEVVNVTSIPRLVLDIGGNNRYANYFSGTGSTALVFKYTVASNDLDLDGIDVANSSDIDLNGGTIRDGNLNGTLLGIGVTTTTRVTAVYPSLRNWYDLSDTPSVTTAGANVMGLTDRIGILNLIHSGAPYSSSGFNGGTHAFASCTAGTYFDTVSTVSTVGFIAVFRSPINTTGYLSWTGITSEPRLRLNTTNRGTMGVTGGQYAAGSFATGSPTASNFWVSSSGAYYARAVRWDSPQTKQLRICDMDGELSEYFMFSTVPTPAEMNQIELYLNAKHGMTFP